jgi:DNA-binding LacI/PurR family transcriptional regulator
VGPDKKSGMLEAVRHLNELGHRRIVLLSRAGRVTPTPGNYERNFLAELNTLGIESGRYNLPIWPDSPEGFHQQLDRLFDVTPPTALILDEVPFLFAAQSHLARRRILAPDDVSLICNDPHPLFEFCRPSIAHIAWNPEPVLRRIVRWADDVAAGKGDRKHRFTRARFVEGGTIGPPRRPASGR